MPAKHDSIKCKEVVAQEFSIKGVLVLNNYFDLDFFC